MLINNRNKSQDISVVARRPQLQSPWPTTERQKFQVGDAVMVRDMPALFYTRAPEYVRGATGEIATVAYESPAAEDEAWDTDPTPEWFYIVRFNQSELWHGYTGTATDTLQTELPERWLQAAT